MPKFEVAVAPLVVVVVLLVVALVVALVQNSLSLSSHEILD